MNPLLDTNCPHCKKDFTTTVPLDKLNLSAGTLHEHGENEVLKKFNELDSFVRDKFKEKPAEKKEKEILVPSYMPSYVCKGENCEGHDNPNYKRRVQKRCTNCNMWGGPKNAKKCAMCGSSDNFEDVDDEELDSLGIPTPGHSHDDV